MNDMRPLILLSNDDGGQAKGLKEVIDMLSRMGDILVVAPGDYVTRPFTLSRRGCASGYKNLCV